MSRIGIVVVLVFFGLVALVLIVFAVPAHLMPAMSIGGVIMNALAVLSVVHWAYWLRVYRRSLAHVRVDDRGIVLVLPSGLERGFPWARIGDIRCRQKAPDAYLEVLAKGAGECVRVHYSLERFEELLVLIAERLRRRHLDPETVVEFRNPNRRLNLLIAVGAAIGFLVAGGSLWSFGCATSAVIVLATASLAASTAACWGFLGVVRTLIDTTGVTRERRCWTTKVPFAEMDDVLIGLTPGQVKLLNVEVRLRSGRRRSLMSPGIDPIALFNTVLEGLRRANP